MRPTRHTYSRDSGRSGFSVNPRNPMGQSWLRAAKAIGGSADDRVCTSWIRRQSKSPAGQLVDVPRRGDTRAPAKVRRSARDQSVNQRAAASAVSSGTVLNAIGVSGTVLRTALTTTSSSQVLFGGSRMPPPITTQS
jgi:hypothetical protein